LHVKESRGNPRIEIRLLGPFDVRIDGLPLARLRTRKGLHLLALLALRPSNEVQREWLVEALWPESEPEQGAYNLRRALSDLRSALGPANTLVTAPTFHTLRLSTLENVSIDLVRFEALCRQQREEALREAVDLYRGPLLEGWNEEWALAPRNACEQDCLRALSLLAAEAEGQQNWTDAEYWLRRIVAIEAFDERAHCRLMEALAHKGNYAAATLVYRELRILLRNEINTEPAAETTALFETLQRKARSAPVDAEPKAPRVESTPTAAKPSALPLPLTSFVGRDAERSDVKALLGKSRLLTLTGTGGCGKTRLALQVAREAEAAYPNGVLWLEFAAVTRAQSVWRVVADGIGAKEQSDRPLEETVCDGLGSRRALLVLDNCEHVLGAMAQMASTLLQRCPSLRILATSREPLNVTGETTWRVPSLSAPHYWASSRTGSSAQAPTFHSVMNYESVRLFADRAALADPRFAIADSNAGDVAQICSRLDGIPLAIELAASRVGTLTASQVASRLDDRFRLLKWGRNDLLPRQQTLRALIDWSYDLLTDLERVLFRRLSVFAGGWTLEAAEGVVSDSTPTTDSLCHQSESLTLDLDRTEVQELHSRLVDKSLVVFEAGPDGRARYRMLETIRQYARERLVEAGEEPIARARHARSFATFASAVAEKLGGPDQSRLLSELDLERENLRAALEATIRSEQGLQMANSLWRYWYVRGHLSEAREWLRQGLESNEGASPSVRALAQLRAGIFAWSQDRISDAEAHFTASLEVFREQGDQPNIGYALHSLGLLAHGKHDYHGAYRYWAESIEIFRHTNNQLSLSGALLNMGAARHSLGDLDRARDLHEQSLRIRRELGDAQGISSSLGGLGRVFVELGDFASAKRCFEECVRLKMELGDRYGLTQTMFGIAYFAAVSNNLRGAVGLLGCMEKMREQMGAGNALDADPGLVEEIRKAREALGSDVYEQAWAEGRNLDAEAAIREILINVGC
jgi:predicted ATPase/DNA-binding SARP family transcriptional activator